MRHRDNRVQRALAIVAALMIVVTGTAFAHSKQEVTFPDDGAVLPVPPMLFPSPSVRRCGSP